ncbi:MAG: GNAT family N-acetyltransferase [Cytophagia bacterium]|nr:MAG: GNAT family N-acetyltransferase [Cytophagales bacterium]TAG36851.1 MAG: GNAT family N-acetyltransferase [Cytophagia bacterium]TAG84411.1 MAG: GNAT family N-acetyltransferase [Cytophagales bacterium]
MIIRKGQLNDLEEIQLLFVETINNISKTDYSSEQINVWASGIKNTQRWQDIVTKQVLIVAENHAQITGFCSLDKGNYIDLLYVHKDYQRQGIANKLYEHIEKAAIQAGQTELKSDVSKTAKPFFEKVGFEVINEQIVIRQGVELTNFKMTKNLIK